MSKLNHNDTAMLYGIVQKGDSIEALDVVRFFASFLQQLRDLTEQGFLDSDGEFGDETWTITEKGREALRDSDSLLDFATLNERP